jgi:site-specific DNA-methyltransferase (adenine-specific)
MNKSTKDIIAFEHPAIFPEELAIKHVITWTKKDDVVYDPFMGSGTTAKASILLGRYWVGSELDKHYTEITNERIKNIVFSPEILNSFITRDSLG